MKLYLDTNLTIQPQNTVLTDETAASLEDPQRTIIAPVGSHYISLKTTGFASMSIIVVLAT